MSMAQRKWHNNKCKTMSYLLNLEGPSPTPHRPRPVRPAPPGLVFPDSRDPEGPLYSETRDRVTWQPTDSRGFPGLPKLTDV